MIAMAVVAAALLSACGSQHGGQEPAAPQSPSTGKSLRVATGQHAGGTQTAGLTGVLRGRANADGTACFWIDNTSKPGSSRVAILWPAGAVAYPDPLRVVNAVGHELGRAGQTVNLTGGFLEGNQMPLLGCDGFTAAFG